MVIKSKKTALAEDARNPLNENPLAAVAQLDRASPSEGEGCGFDPRLLQGHFSLKKPMNTGFRADKRENSNRVLPPSTMYS